MKNLPPVVNFAHWHGLTVIILSWMGPWTLLLVYHWCSPVFCQHCASCSLKAVIIFGQFIFALQSLILFLISDSVAMLTWYLFKAVYFNDLAHSWVVCYWNFLSDWSMYSTNFIGPHLANGMLNSYFKWLWFASRKK